MHPKRFIAIVTGCCLAATATVVAVNWTLDPTGLLQVAGVRDEACAAGLRGDEITIKTLAAHHARARTLLIGTSQVAVGLDPGTLPSAWREGGAFNLGISAATLATLAAVLPYAMSGGQTERIILGLGPSMMARNPAGDPRPQPSPFWVARFLFMALLSPVAIRESERLLLHASRCRDPEFRADGFRRGAPMAFAPEEVARLPQRIANLVRPDAPLFGQPDLASLFDDLCRRNVKLVVALMPQGLEWQLINWHLPGGWARLEEFKRNVVDAAATMEKSGCAIPVHDFNRIEVATTAAQETAHPPFLDSVHFTPVFGRKLLDEITGTTADAGEAALGRRLDAGNLAAHLAAQRALIERVAGEADNKPR